VRYLPVFVDLKDQKVIVSGSTEAAVAKIRLLLKTPAHIKVFTAESSAQIESWSNEGRITLFRRPVNTADVAGACLLYAGNSNAAEDARAAAIGEAAGVMVNVVDNAEASAFITPAIVDRDPLVVAIGTEGAAPVLARRIKAQIERTIPASAGALARAGKRFRPEVKRLPSGRSRRAFWREFYDCVGPNACSEGGEAALEALLDKHLERPEFASKKRGKVWIVGAGICIL
jgi:uroporphyrin-III C-methyltransferase/precorrin-2 dehydrogenase/sirohydrochlorin ferrochelatase